MVSSSWMSTMTTPLAPDFANDTAIASPRPRPPPVTKATPGKREDDWFVDAFQTVKTLVAAKRSHLPFVCEFYLQDEDFRKIFDTESTFQVYIFNHHVTVLKEVTLGTKPGW
jgi:hypothetical protein